jgi:hypothetical protein
MRTKLSFILLIIFLLGGKIYAQMGVPRLIITEGLNNIELRAQIEKNASLLLTALEKTGMEEYPNLSNINISSEASKTLLSIWETSRMSCPNLNVERKCLQRPQGGYQVRDIPITMEGSPKEEQMQHLVINFTKEGKIDDIFLAVHGIMDALYGNTTVQDFVRKQRILEFVERFRTAYNEKDITYLKTVFSNNAIIITGKVIKEQQNSDQVLKGNLNSERIEYVIQSKERYLERLKVVFTVNKYISVKFDEIEVTQHPRYPEIYGVTLKQDWHTTNYSDKGYVFLLIDFKNEDEPLIHIRTWQPDKFKGKELPKEERFTLDSFTRIAR